MIKRKTPLMGWASWNKYRVNISEAMFKKQLQALVDLGLRDLGYVYFNIDDGFQCGRGADGFVNADENKFPNGMKAFADYVHSLGFKAGIYTDAGVTTCAQIWDGLSYNDNVGLYGYDVQDLNMYLNDWGYDFIKVDWCGGQKLGLDRQERYTEISKIIKDIEESSGKNKIFNVCCWEFPGKWVADVADSWRTGSDISPEFDSILYQIDKVAKSETRSLELTCPGHVNDLDMLQVGNGMSYEEDKSHFTMWAMMSTPLMLGMDLTSIADDTLEIIKNHEVIAINQDAACLPPYVIKTACSCEVWIKPLFDKNEMAVAFLNRNNSEVTVAADWKELGFSTVKSVRDLWAHKNINSSENIEFDLPAHGVAVFRVRSENNEELACQSTPINDTPETISVIDENNFAQKIFDDALLVDVRSPDEYHAGHLDGSINLPHNEIFLKHREVFDSRDSKIILYCNTTKRSSQAFDILKYLGYKNLYCMKI